MQLYKNKTKQNEKQKSINQDLLKHKSLITTNIIQIIIKKYFSKLSSTLYYYLWISGK